MRTTKNVRRIVPLIGHIRLDRLRREHVQRCYNELVASGLSPRTVAQAHRVLRRAMNQAISSGLIAVNPCKQATPPRAERSEMNILSRVELHTLFEATTTDRLHPLWVLLATTGMRVGEATALRWEDIDLETGRATIRRTLRRASGNGRQFAR